MSREIKFRGKRLDNNEWVFGCYYYLSGCIYIIEQSTGYFDINYGEEIFSTSYCHEVDENTIGQYTGLKDKNEKEIYEGDIVKIDGFDDELNEHFLVKFENESARYILSGNCLVYDFDYIFGSECEIIGNKYENPELEGEE